MEGIGRYYIKNVISEKPYLRAKVQIFSDFSLNNIKLNNLEKLILNEVRYSVKIMKLLYPSNNYTLNELVIKNRPFLTSTTSTSSTPPLHIPLYSYTALIIPTHILYLSLLITIYLYVYTCVYPYYHQQQALHHRNR